MNQVKNKYFGSVTSATPLVSLPTEQPSAQVSSKKRFGKKMYITVAAVVAIAVILVAVLFIPQGNAGVISLGVQYSAGEKLTYNVASSMSTQNGNSSTNLSSQSTLTVDVVSFDGETYTLNYTSISSDGGFSMTSSQVIDVKASEMVTVLALLPVGLQLTSLTANSTSPAMAAVFNQSQAQVGDTWQVPLNTAASGYTPAANLTVTFKAIQELTVPAGTFKVFRIDFSANTQGTQSSPLTNIDLSGQSYLEFGTCKQIQSSLQLTLPFHVGNENENIVDSFTSTLTQDQNP